MRKTAEILERSSSCVGCTLSAIALTSLCGILGVAGYHFIDNLDQLPGWNSRQNTAPTAEEPNLGLSIVGCSALTTLSNGDQYILHMVSEGGDPCALEITPEDLRTALNNGALIDVLDVNKAVAGMTTGYKIQDPPPVVYDFEEQVLAITTEPQFLSEGSIVPLDLVEFTLGAQIDTRRNVIEEGISTVIAVYGKDNPYVPDTVIYSTSDKSKPDFMEQDGTVTKEWEGDTEVYFSTLLKNTVAYYQEAEVKRQALKTPTAVATENNTMPGAVSVTATPTSK